MDQQLYSRLLDNAIWLEPFDATPVSNPLVATLLRLNVAGQKLHLHGSWEQELQLVANAAAQFMPGNLDQYSGQLDQDAFAYEVIRAERGRVDFPNRLQKLMDDVKQVFSQLTSHDPIFCVSLIDFDLNFKHLTEVARGLDPYMKYFEGFLVSDVASVPFGVRNAHRYHRMTSDEYEELVETVTDDSSIKPKKTTLVLPTANLPPVSAPLPFPGYPWDEDFEEEPPPPPKPKPLKPRFRSIDDP